MATDATTLGTTSGTGTVRGQTSGDGLSLGLTAGDVALLDHQDGTDPPVASGFITIDGVDITLDGVGVTFAA